MPTQIISIADYSDCRQADATSLPREYFFAKTLVAADAPENGARTGLQYILAVVSFASDVATAISPADRTKLEQAITAMVKTY